MSPTTSVWTTLEAGRPVTLCSMRSRRWLRDGRLGPTVGLGDGGDAGRVGGGVRARAGPGLLLTLARLSRTAALRHAALTYTTVCAACPSC